MSDSPLSQDRFRQAYAGQAPWDIGGPQPAVVEAADFLAPPEGVSADAPRLLDAGCGTGDNALFFAARGCRVLGMDFVGEAVSRARAKAAAARVAAEFREHDALRLVELPERFELALDCGLFHVFDDAARARYAAQLTEAILPGGRLLLLCFSDREPAGEGPRRVSAAELRSAFAEGWSFAELEPVRFAVAEFAAGYFSPGGPHAWRASLLRRGG